MIFLVNERLGAFLINQNFLKNEYYINSPFKSEEVKFNNLKVKYYYDNQSNKFKKLSYDFIMDEFLERNYDKSKIAENNIINARKYHLAEIIIFIPEKFHIVMKIKISEYSSILEVRSDCLKIIEYLDEYFDTWV